MESNGKNGQSRAPRGKRSKGSATEVVRALDGKTAWLTRPNSKERVPPDATFHEVGDLWGGDVSHLRRNILT